MIKILNLIEDIEKYTGFGLNVTKIKLGINLHQRTGIMLPKYNTFLRKKACFGNNNFGFFYYGQYLYET